MDPLEMNISAYGHIREHLELQHQGDWVVLHNRELAGIYSSYEEAHKKALGRFGPGPCLIVEVGGEWIGRRVKEVRAKAAKWLADAGGSALVSRTSLDAAARFKDDSRGYIGLGGPLAKAELRNDRTSHRPRDLISPFVIGELACGTLPDQSDLQRLCDLPQIVRATHDEVLSLMESHRFMGRGIGYIDAHLLASGIRGGSASLWTRDRRLA